MPLGKLNLFGSQRLPLQNPGFQQPAAPGQFGGGNYTPMLGRGLQKFLPMLGGQGSLPMPPGLSRIMNGLKGGFGGGMPGAQEMPGAQGYPAPGYPPQGIGPQQPAQTWQPAQTMQQSQGYPAQGFGPQQPVQTRQPGQTWQPAQTMPQAQGHPPQGYPSQGFLSQGYPSQGYQPQGYNPGYGGQIPVQPAAEQPKKGGILTFISNFLAKRKK